MIRLQSRLVSLMNPFRSRVLTVSLLLLALGLSGCGEAEREAAPAATAETEPVTVDTGRISSFGEYQGYSQPAFDGFARESVYVPVADGTRIALDIFHPTRSGRKPNEPLPVAFQVTRYWRAFELKDGSLRTGPGLLPPGESSADLRDPSLPLEGDENVNTDQELLRHGYIVVVMDSRGTGASFGTQTQDFSAEMSDMKQVIEWIAAQSWSDGKVGMYGVSWLGFIQFIAALGQPEPLKALFPAVANFPDFQRIGSPRGGYLKGAMLTMRKTLVGLSDVEDAGQAGGDALAALFGEDVAGVARVDEDSDGSLRDQARAGHGSASFDMYIAPVMAHPVVQEAVETLELDTPDQVIDTLFYADALNTALQGHPELRDRLAAAQWPQPQMALSMVDFMLGGLSKAAIPTYLWDGWQDPGPTERMLWYFNLDMPRRLTMGPWSHGPNEPDDPSARAYTALMTVEILRWFDYWLRGIDNGVMDEQALAYAVMQDKNSWEWRHADTFPPPESKPMELYFGEGRSGSSDSVNDGRLVAAAPDGSGDRDEVQVDYSANSGNHTRYHDATGGGPIDYPDFAPNDARGLTYTSDPLESDIVTAGFPLVTLYADASIADPVFAVYLEEVTPDGRSTMVSLGAIRASHRAPWKPPYDTNGVPWTSSMEADIMAAAPLTDGPQKIHYALEPVSNRWDKGNRIRLTVMNADETVLWVIPHDPPPTVGIWRDAQHPSMLQLQVID